MILSGLLSIVPNSNLINNTMANKENNLIWEKYKENPKYYTILKAKPKL